ncbi:MAG: metalloprotease TldD [Myxococcales bacterium]|nr:metalloprotease TldD [Myxococcales bacterium]|tara:strand:+ start:90 stop:1505 length:1416 start_codon:yes stop_codon:yes gene_type:complete
MAPPILSQDILEKTLEIAMSTGADYADVYVQKRKTTGLSLDNGEIRSSAAGQTAGVGIRVTQGASTAYAHSEDLSPDAIFDCARTVSKLAKDNVAPAVNIGLTSRAEGDFAKALLPPTDITLEQRLELLQRGEAKARTLRNDIDRILGYYGDTDEVVQIATSEGDLFSDSRCICRLSLRTIIKDKDGKRRVGVSGGGNREGFSYFKDHFQPEAMAAESIRMAEAQLGARPAPIGEQTVVVGPKSSGVLLHEAVGHGLEADFIRKKTSLFTGRVGELVASPLVTVIDDGTLPGMRGSLNVDDEGTLPRRNVLIENGILKGFINDKLNARLMGTSPTGNGRRQSFRCIPIPRMTSTFMLGGQDDPADIIKGVQNGFYCRAFGGGQVNIGNGNFVFEVQEGYLIEDGKITAPVEGATLVGNGPETLSKIAAVGHDLDYDPGVYTCGKDGQSVPVNVGQPTLRIDGITVGGTGQE